jgi:hypothetical protein
MSRRYGAPVQPARHRVYDNDPERITRPDIGPAALRSAENSDVSSGVERRGTTRELAPYPRVTDLTPPPRNELTVVDPPLRRASSVAVPRDPEERRATFATDELPSGPRHRTVSTVPPPSRARSKPARTVNVVIPSEEQQRSPKQVPSRASPPRKGSVTRRWSVVLAFALTAMGSAAVGTTLGNGSFERVVGRLVVSPPPRATTFILPISEAWEKPREPLLSPSLEPTPMPEAEEVPSVRLEDLPLAKQGKPRIESKRAAGARRSPRKKL